MYIIDKEKKMSVKKSNEALDTMKFNVPKAEREYTRVYNIPKKNTTNKVQSNSNTNNTVKKPATVKQTKKTMEKKPESNANKTTPSYQPKPQSNAPNNPPLQKQKKKKKKTLSFYLISALVIMIAIFGTYSAVAMNYISKVSDIDKTNTYINDDSTMLYSSDVKNILIIGTDTRDNSYRGLSDSMILLSVNKKNKKLQMTSFMRDIYVEIEGHGSDKLNAAFSYGGAELLENTIEDTFRIRIDGCVIVNFTAVAHIVDAVGGVEITLSDSEAQAVNDILYSEVNQIMGDSPDSDFITGGTHKLNGKQALSYSRIRYVGNADFERTQRQRTVITQILSQMSSANPFTLNKNIKKALPYISTDLSDMDMYILCLRLPFLITGYKTEQMRVPVEESWWYDESWDGQSIIGVDFYTNIEYLKNNIYLVE